MSADLIKEKIAQAVEKINHLKEELKLQKAENEELNGRLTEMHATNLELNDRIQKLEGEKRDLTENNETTVKDIEDRLALLTELLEGEAGEEQSNSTEQQEFHQHKEHENFF